MKGQRHRRSGPPGCCFLTSARRRAPGSGPKPVFRPGRAEVILPHRGSRKKPPHGQFLYEELSLFLPGPWPGSFSWSELALNKGPAMKSLEILRQNLGREIDRRRRRRCRGGGGGGGG